MILAGYAREDDEPRLNEYGNSTKSNVNCEEGYSAERREIMTTFYARHNNLSAVRYWFTYELASPEHSTERVTPSTVREVTKACFRSDKNTDWFREFVKKMMLEEVSKPVWDAILHWSVLYDGHGPDEIKAMIEKKSIEVDVATLNSLIEAAIDKNDPYMAERFFSYGFAMGLKPNAETLILQMNYRLAANDLSGADGIYEHLVHGEIEVPGDEDLPVINKYVRALCDAANPKIDRILQIVGHLENRNSVMFPETLAAFCLVMLKADRQIDVINMLSIHAQYHSLEQRETIHQALVAYCLDVNNSTARAWDSYSLLRQFFPETKRHLRHQIMQSFFQRKRPDMAVHVFGHMRGHTDESMHPDSKLYVACLEGLGQFSDGEGVRLVHNMLKMDTRVPMDTKMYNALMIAYMGCEQYRKTMEFWREITILPEGPSLQSLEIVLTACEYMPFGDKWARVIWRRVERMDIDVPPQVYTAYLGALASGGFLEEVKRAIQGMNAAMSYAPQIATFAVVFNALTPSKQKTFEKWAIKEFPEIWARVASLGRKVTQGRLQIKYNRRLEA
ncbi:hypothetical protein P8C59_004131 [Phyllachora maydis]|uniref:Uncharacterized protein n=1 Tax=Phyllachora maydis TaxID=1825666 RepID=A0AAD9I340_9PEZI|nr:hypothetical protein P8C59_004131 [Phyllachora maydis]